LGKIVVRFSADADKADDPDADKADNPDADKGDDDMKAQGFLNMFTNVKNMNNSDDDLGGGDLTRRAPTIVQQPNVLIQSSSPLL
jgi:hypothetical protein